MRRVILTEPAESDLEDISYWIAQHAGLDAGRRAIERIVAKFGLIARAPGIGRRRDELVPGCRGLSAGKHLILYRVTRDGLCIIRVLDARRDLDRALDRR